MKNLMIMLILAVAVIAASGCEYQTVTHRRVALFYKSENNGDVSKSRDVSSFTHRRSGNKTDKALRKFFKTK
jgi:hypothetical protein